MGIENVIETLDIVPVKELNFQNFVRHLEFWQKLNIASSWGSSHRKVPYGELNLLLYITTKILNFIYICTFY